MVSLNLVTVFSASESDSDELEEKTVDQEKVVEAIEEQLLKAKRRLASLQLRQRSKKKEKQRSKRDSQGLSKSASHSKMPKVESSPSAPSDTLSPSLPSGTQLAQVDDPQGQADRERADRERAE